MTDGAPRASATDLEVRAWWLWALTALALAIRVVGLNSGLWADEIDSLVTSFRPPLVEIVSTFPRDNRHPFYSVLAHLAMAVFGEHYWVIRLPAMLAGTATVPLLYLLGAQVASRREALLAAALLSVSYHHVWFSQNARGYAILGTCAVLSAWLLLRCLEDGRRRWWVGYAATIALGSWTHLTMVFVAVGHAAACGILFLAARRRHPAATWRRLAAAFVLSALFTLLLYAPVLGDVAHYFTAKPSGLRGISTPLWALEEGLRMLRAGLGGAGAVVAVIALPAAALLFGAGLRALWRSHPLVLGLFTVPGLVTVAGALAARGTMYPRFFFALAPYGVLIAVLGAFALARALARVASSGDAVPRRAVGLASAAIGMLTLLSVLTLPRLWRYPKQDYEGAWRWVQAHRAPGDTAATVDLTTGLNNTYFHWPTATVTTAPELAQLRTGRRVWLVYTFPRYLERGAPEIHAITERECGDAQAFRGTVGGGDVYVCDLGPTP